MGCNEHEGKHDVLLLCGHCVVTMVDIFVRLSWHMHQCCCHYCYCCCLIIIVMVRVNGRVSSLLLLYC